MVGKNGAFGAVLAGVVGDGNQISAVLASPFLGNGMQGLNAGRQVKMAAAETTGNFPGTFRDTRSFLFCKNDSPLRIALGPGTRLGWRRRKQRLLAGFIQPFHRGMRKARV